MKPEKKPARGEEKPLAKKKGRAKYITFQLAGVSVPRKLFAAILERIGRLRLACASG